MALPKEVKELANMYRKEINRIFKATPFKCSVKTQRSWRHSYRIQVDINKIPTNFTVRNDDYTLTYRAQQLTKTIEDRIDQLVIEHPSQYTIESSIMWKHIY